MGGSVRGLAQLAPVVGWSRRYDRRWLGDDLVGGIAAGSVVIPQAIAYASIADLPAQVGLYTCIVPMLAYVVLGGSRTLSMSTTSTVAVLTGSTLLALQVVAGSGDPARNLATLTVLVGVILLGARLLRLGWLVDGLSDATLTGVKIGVGITVAVAQLPVLLGVDFVASPDAFFPNLSGVLTSLDAVSWTTAALAVATIALLVVCSRRLPRVPGPLVAVAIGISLVAAGSIDDHGVALIAPVPSGLPSPILPDLSRLDGLVGGAFAIATMCFLETASVAHAVRRRTEPPIDNDQELLANGVACVLGGFFRAMPAAGGFSQTAISRRAGSRTQLSAAVTAALAVCCALFLGSVFSDLPQATLGAMVVVAVAGLIEPAEVHRYWHIDRLSFWITIVTASAGVVLGLLAAVITGVVASLVLLIHEIGRLGITELQPGTAEGDLEVAGTSTRPEAGLVVLHIDGPLYAANVRRVHRAVLEVADARTPRTVVLDAGAMARTTVTVIDQLAELHDQLADRGVALWFAGLSPDVLAMAQRTVRWSDIVAEGRLHSTAAAAMRAHRSDRR
ncbi:MAG TPA: SulP family inorganic anion transporter [Acidimicrobiales bacterium]|nr:SulP family inorganic anion transporter [Acidimicrobiales bacterium]